VLRWTLLSHAGDPTTTETVGRAATPDVELDCP